MIYELRIIRNIKNNLFIEVDKYIVSCNHDYDTVMSWFSYFNSEILTTELSLIGREENPKTAILFAKTEFLPRGN